MKTTYTF